MSAAAGGSSPSGALGPQEFAERFAEDYRCFWLIALGIVRDRALAEDVVQEAALTGLEKLGEFAPGSNFRAWLSQIVRFIALNHVRKRRRRRTGLLGDDAGESLEMPDHAPPPEGHAVVDPSGRLLVEQSHFDDRLLAALQSVSDSARACLLLRVVEGLEYREIAALLDMPEGTAMSHVHRARTHLRRWLSGTDTGGEAR